MITLKTAKASSLKKWNKILSEFPNITYKTFEAECGFCKRYDYVCNNCELKTINACGSTYENPSLWGKINRRFEEGKQDAKLQSLIKKMIKAIESVEAQK